MAQGHDLSALLDGYPALVVKGLVVASRLNRRRELTEEVMALSVAVTGALDLALNRGKGRVLEKWVEEVLSEGGEKKAKPKISERALAFFGSLPRKEGHGHGAPS